MDNLTLGVILLLLTGFLWVTGAMLQWHNIRRQERMIARLRRLALRRARRPGAVGAALPVAPKRSGKYLRRAKRWTVG